MARVIGIDHGTKRSGIAVTDPGRIIASALATVPAEEVLAFLKAYVEREAVEGFVVGLPMSLGATATDATAHVLAFIDRLKSSFPEQWVETADERFTSRMAQHTLLESGKGRTARRDKSQLDRISATIILQGWLEQRSAGSRSGG